MKGMSRYSQMANVRNPSRCHKWKNDRAGQRVAAGSGSGLCESKPGGPPEANADPLGILVNTDSGGSAGSHVFTVQIRVLEVLPRSIVCGEFNGSHVNVVEWGFCFCF